MNELGAAPRFSDGDILKLRGPKRVVDPHRPYAFFTEPEFSAAGVVEDVATVFLTNRECPFRCLMCDLWQNTTDSPVPNGALPAQIDYALERLPPASHLKLYNSGNFFDPHAVPFADHAAIAERTSGFRRLIIENHPRLCGDACQDFQRMLSCELEIAIGLETIHPDVLPRLNKRMTLSDFEAAVARLRATDIHVRAFVLLRPPFLKEAEGLEWARRSIRFAFDAGVECCAVIPTRGGNGIMEQLQKTGQFESPRLESLERIMEDSLAAGGGRVFADLWNVEQLSSCGRCGPRRQERLRIMNLTQKVPAAVTCEACHP